MSMNYSHKGASPESANAERKPAEGGSYGSHTTTNLANIKAGKGPAAMARFLCLIFFIQALLALAYTEASAQPPRGAPRGGAGRGTMPPPQAQANRGEEIFVIEHFPDIHGITPAQRTKVGDILISEHREISRLIDRKNQYIHSRQSVKEKKQVEKIDMKIARVRSKSDRKIEKILNREQYISFIMTRSEFRLGRGATDAFRRPEGERPNGGIRNNGGRSPRTQFR